MSNLPPLAKNGFRSTTAEFSTPSSIFSASSMSFATLKRRQSQDGSLNTTYLNASSAVTTGSGPASVPQPSSEPRSRSGAERTAPVFGCLIGAYSDRAVSTCGFVRHDGPSAPLHSRTFGSKWQRDGSSSTPSFTPSSVSQASITASWRALYLDGGI